MIKAEERQATVSHKLLWYRRLQWLLAGLATVIIIVTLVMLVIQSQRVADLVKAEQRNSQLLIDCTTPHHDCYDNANKNTSKAIASINEVTVIAVACAREPLNTTTAQVKACVEQELKKEGK